MTKWICPCLIFSFERFSSLNIFFSEERCLIPSYFDNGHIDLRPSNNSHNHDSESDEGTNKNWSLWGHNRNKYFAMIFSSRWRSNRRNDHQSLSYACENPEKEKNASKHTRAHTKCNCEREREREEQERKNGIPNETIRLGTDGEKDLDCMVAFLRILCLLLLRRRRRRSFHTLVAYPKIIS